MNTKNIKFLLVIIFIFSVSIGIYSLSKEKTNSNLEENSTNNPSSNKETTTANTSSIDSSDDLQKVITEQTDPRDFISSNPKNNLTNTNNNSTSNINPNNDNNSSTNNTNPNQVVTNNLNFIDLNSYKATLKTTPYTIKSGDTISKLLKELKINCNYPTAIKYLTLLNPTLNLNELKIGSVINIPMEAFTSGNLYKVVSGETLYNIAITKYPTYDPELIARFLVNLNNLPTNNLPLGENVFLPKL